LTNLRVMAIAAVAASARLLHAQSSAEVNAGIQYNFSSPGAHSLARAGAFIADASDATAAYTNPAGLVNVPLREISIEGRGSEFVNTYGASGHAFGPPSNIGNDVISGIRTAKSSNRVQNVPFASIVVPLDRYFSERRVTVAAYRHELANFAATQSTQGIFFDIADPDGGAPITGFRHYPSVSDLRLRIAGAGVAVGFRATDRLSLGLGLRGYRSTIDSVTTRFLTPGPSGDPDYTDPHSIQRQHGNERTTGVNVGLLFDLHEKLTVGATFRQGFSFPVDVDYTSFIGGESFRRQQGRFNVPAFYGLGASIRPTDDWSVAVDVNRITYSDTTRGFVYLFEEEPRYFVPDGTEIRIGTELTLTRDRFNWLPFPIYVAAGVWRDPDHSIRASNPDDSQSIFFRETAADIHVTGGIGMTAGTRAQLHVAFDRSARQTVLSLSAMARF
jgi:long-chain fatty acid transport protein